MASGCQVQGQGEVEWQGEDREVPLAEDGTQGTSKDGARDEREKRLMAVINLQPTLSSPLWSQDHSLFPFPWHSHSYLS